MRMKTIYLYALMITASTLILACVGPTQYTANIQKEPTVTEMETRILVLVNQAREKNGLAPLSTSLKLSGFARSHSMEMAAHRHLAHTDNNGNGLEARVKLARLTGWREIGENVARSFGYEDSEKVVVEGWLKSPAHRENIMERRYDLTGIGVTRGEDGYFYATQVFAASVK